MNGDTLELPTKTMKYRYPHASRTDGRSTHRTLVASCEVGLLLFENRIRGDACSTFAELSDAHIHCKSMAARQSTLRFLLICYRKDGGTWRTMHIVI